MIKNIIIIMLLFTLTVGGYLASNTIDILKSTITSLHIKHKQTLVKTNIKERGKRVITAIPIVGLIAISRFEKREYDEWKEENPDGSPELYAREVANIVQEVADDYYQDITNENPSLNLSSQESISNIAEQAPLNESDLK